MISSSVTVDRAGLGRLADLEVLPVAHEPRTLSIRSGHAHTEARPARGDGRRPRLQQLRRPRRRGGNARRRRRRARRGRHVLRHRRHLRQRRRQRRAARPRRCKGGATRSSSRRSSGSRWATAPSAAARASTSVSAIEASLRAAADRRDRPLPAPRGGSGHAARGDGRARSRSSSPTARSARTARRTTAPETLERAKALAVRRVRLGAERVLVARTATPEAELLPTCERLGLGFIPYFPLASGLLTGKVSREQPPAEGTRLHGRVDRRRRSSTRSRSSSAWAEAHGVTLLDVAVGGLLAVKPVASVIAGATKPEQVRANAAAGRVGADAPSELAELQFALGRTTLPGRLRASARRA